MLEDYRVAPPIFWKAVRHLCPHSPPRIDAFAARHNAVRPLFWSAETNAFRQGWWREDPLWMNPPFRLQAVWPKSCQARVDTLSSSHHGLRQVQRPWKAWPKPCGTSHTAPPFMPGVW